MYHLLPPEDKKKLRSEYRMRRAAVILFLLSALAIVFFLSLLPAYLLALEKKDLASADLASISAKNDPDAENKLLAQITSARERISLLMPQNGPTVFDALHSAVLKRPKDIRITGFFFNANTPGEVHIEGVASTRESLLGFEEILRSERIFSSVDLPISSFAASQDISFAIVAKGAF